MKTTNVPINAHDYFVSQFSEAKKFGESGIAKTELIYVDDLYHHLFLYIA